MLTFRHWTDEDRQRRQDLIIETGMGDPDAEPDPDPWPTVAKTYPPLAQSRYPTEAFDADDNLVARFNFSDSAKPDFDVRNPDSMRNIFYETLLQEHEHGEAG
jgi:hypothetical protein